MDIPTATANGKTFAIIGNTLARVDDSHAYRCPDCDAGNKDGWSILRDCATSTPRIRCGCETPESTYVPCIRTSELELLRNDTQVWWHITARDNWQETAENRDGFTFHVGSMSTAVSYAEELSYNNNHIHRGGGLHAYAFRVKRNVHRYEFDRGEHATIVSGHWLTAYANRFETGGDVSLWGTFADFELVAAVDLTPSLRGDDTDFFELLADIEDSAMSVFA